MDTHTAEIACKVKFDNEIKRLETVFHISLTGVTLNISPRKARKLGHANIKTNEVWLNANYFDSDENIGHIMNQTITHEICHIVEYKAYGTAGHGKMWKTLMRVAGKTPDRLASVILPEAVKKPTNKVTVACGFCQKQYTITNVHWTRIKNRTTRRSICTACNHHLSFGKLVK